MYLTKDEIYQFTVELTTKCNAACPMCSRYNYKWDTRRHNPQLPMLDFDLKVFKNFITPEIASRTGQFLFNGKFGDALMHKDIMEFIKYIKAHSDAIIEIHTNGSLRSLEWWEELGNVLSDRDCVTFNVDGLRDTNLIYRQKTDFDKIMRNAKTFIDSGGQAKWEFLVFKHNEHQVEEAKRLAKEIGFFDFIYRKSSRFKDRGDFHYIDVNGDAAVLSPATTQEFVYDFAGTYLEGERPKVFKELNIKCDWKHWKKMFLSPTHKLWPCTYISEYYPELPGFNTMQEIKERHGTEFNDITKYSLDEILHHEFFAHELETAWKTGKHITKECWKKCSVGRRSITETKSINEK